jgi:MFS transporter, AAHS family, 4-hydroxybenzoate transporter
MPNEIDVSEWIDSRPLGRFQIMVAVLCAATLLMEGFDSQGISYAAPSMIRDWHISAPGFAAAFSAGLTGALAGVLALSTAADYFGRRAIIVICTAAAGVLTLITPAVHDLNSLTVLRLLTGFALGGTIPNTISVTAEFGPQRARATLITIMVCGIGLGAAAGGPIAAQLIPRFGWQAVFYAGGAFALALSLLLFFALPESPRLLALKPGRDARVAALLRKMFPHEALSPQATFVNREERRAGLTVSHLFAEGRGAMTIVIWLMFALNMLDMYLLRSWLPTVFTSAGFSLQRAALTSSVLDGAGILGTVAVGWVLDRLNPCRVLALLYFAGGVFTALIGFSIISPNLVVGAVALAGVGLLAAQNASNAVVVSLYPTYVRSTSIGWAIGVGRIGSIVGPLLGGLMLALHWDLRTLFMVSALPAIGAAALAMSLAHLARRSESVERRQPKVEFQPMQR